MFHFLRKLRGITQSITTATTTKTTTTWKTAGREENDYALASPPYKHKARLINSLKPLVCLWLGLCRSTGPADSTTCDGWRIENQSSRGGIYGIWSNQKWNILFRINVTIMWFKWFSPSSGSAEARSLTWLRLRLTLTDLGRSWAREMIELPNLGWFDF